ncbi:mammalian cell entry protein [Prescottella equi]|uniref:mammalian cell entry protein n=1 Tax=Rhodococcus hoagii TaxID=43767 RepID=UPI001C2F3DB1|nr:mammalian cell entry protein [Prescottella equi]
MTVVVAITVAVLAGVAGWLYWGPGGMRETDATERARSEVLDIVDGKVVAMLGYNHNTAQDQLHAAAEGLTDGYKAEYLELVDKTIAPGAKEKAIDVQVTSSAKSVVEASPDRVVTLLYLNQITTSSESPEAVSSGSRVRVEMVKDGDDWLINWLTPI